jgi:hypothetical protein
VPPIVNGCIAYWKLGNNGSDEVSLIDSTGNGYSLTNNNGVTLGTGIISGNGSASFDNSANNTLTNDSINVGPSFSIGFWVNVTDFSGGVVAFSFMSGGSPAFVTAPDVQYYFYGNAGEGDLNSPATASANIGEWNHVVAVVDDAAQRLSWYLNGSRMDFKENRTGYGNWTGITLGAYPERYIGTINAKIDEVGIWNRPLSGNSVLALYNAGAGLTYPFTN